MTFGGAETLIYNYCREIKDQFNISFVTGLHSEHEWEYKFKEITPYVYHLANLFEDDKNLHLEFLSNYIATHHIDILNIIHNGFTFEFLAELKSRHPKLKVVVTMFNDRVEYFEQSAGYEDYIDAFVSDNSAVANHYRQLLKKEGRVFVIPNGINCYDEFSQKRFDRKKIREELKIAKDELAVFFVGRLSAEKNPYVFVRTAALVADSVKQLKIKFFVVGDGPMRPDIEKLIAENKQADVTYLGYQSNVAKYLSSADIFVLPSSIEGFPLSILEAMAMKVAVIASDVGAVRDVLGSGKAGYVVTPGSVEEIRDNILQLSNNPELLIRIKNDARKEVEAKYSNKILGENYRKMYAVVLE
jgi:glycosyltransferase involved in cell wall biosynthesis